MRLHFLSRIIFLFVGVFAFGQNKIDLKAEFNVDKKQIKISQTIIYHNTSQDTLHDIYLNDWSNSYSTKSTPLAIRFTEEYKKDFHFAKNEDRGYTVITSLQQDNKNVVFERLKNNIDVIKVTLNKPLKPNTSYTLNLDYIVQVQNDKFTRYGVDADGNYKLRYWYITPAVYNNEWQYFSNKDLDDLFVSLSDINLNITIPINYKLTSELNQTDYNQTETTKTITLQGENRISSKLFLSTNSKFNHVETDLLTIVTNIKDQNLNPIDKVLITDKIVSFLNENLGSYPHKKLLLTHVDYRKNPIYGLNLLPDFIRPFPDNFQYELKLLKTALNNYLENILIVNPRKDQWLIDGFQTYFLMKYVDENYPNMKIFGSFSKIWGIKSFYAAQLEFNDQYNFLFRNVARTNLDQPLLMKKDSLLKFNKNIANKYKAGIGLNYLNDFINEENIENTIKEFVENNTLKETTTQNFETLIKSKTTKDIDWFFSTYLNTSKKIDYKIDHVITTTDSITVTIKNKRDNNMPISLFALKDDVVISKTWISNINNTKTVTIANNNATKLVLNYDNVVPEHNTSDNTKSLTGSLFNRPLQLRLIKDVEDSRYNQFFIMPIIEYNNIYDGLILGAKVYNKTILKKPFTYKIAPQYGTKSKSFTGSANLIYHQYFNNIKNLHKIKYVLSGGFESYADNLFVTAFKPSVSFHFKNTDDLRSNKRQFLSFRFVSINRDEDVNNIAVDVTDPNYNIFNARFINSNPGLINFSSWFADFQASSTFSKVSFNYEFRRLFQNNRQLTVRFFAGAFISNKNDASTDYFSFALDRPTDYLFDYGYLGRSENTGLFSQQIIIAEGGFKSKLNTPFANQWMTTLNVSTSIWNYIHVYGDLGTLKNKYQNAKFVYDSGLRVNLVEDYFEIFFPVYSNLGWEIAQPQYSQKIRFKFTVDIESLLGLFRRRWY